MSKLVGIDIGGTFTDLVVIDTKSGELKNVKVSSTPPNHALGIFNALKKADVDLKDVGYFVHGCTVATNIVVERKGAKVGLITTKGFRDILEIMRCDREFHYYLQWEKPEPLVPRYLRLEVTERLDYKGNVLIPLNEEDVRQAARFFKKEGVEAVAICTLHSFTNPVHELRIEEIVKEEYPEVFTSVSARILPEIREYERTCTVVMDSYVKPEVVRYTEYLIDNLQDKGLDQEMMMMKSNGAVMTPKMTLDTPIATIGSGPAGGVMGATMLGDEIITCDLGGTSFDVSLITKGQPKLTTQKDVTWGMPLRVPQIDVLSIGSGGGSIAWIDAGGLLRVGPQSARSIPGPACYGKGGEDPTITDACLVLGILNDKYFLGGDMEVDVSLSVKAIENKLCKQLNMSVLEVAAGIYKVAVADMTEAIKMVSVSQGFDPRNFWMVPYGGGGPLFASKLAFDLQIPKLIYPRNPGVFSAMGCLSADVQFDQSQSYLASVEDMDLDKLNRILDELEDKCRKSLSSEGYDKNLEVTRSADMRYVGQNFEVNAMIPSGKINPKKLQEMVNNFNEEHEKWYGYMMQDAVAETVSLRVSVKSRQPFKPTYKVNKSKTDLKAALKGVRKTYFGDDHGFMECPIYNRDLLCVGHQIPGPAIIEQSDTTNVIYPEYMAVIDELENIVATLK